jgi:acetyltransferase-like isoleucine patch superfamily enzyme
MSGAQVGSDCNIGEHAFIESGAVVGNRVTVKNGAMIWRGVTVDDDVFIGPGVLFTNDKHPRSPRSDASVDRYRNEKNWLAPTRVHRGATLGAGSIILCGLEIGACAVVAAGAVVTRNVAAHSLVLGNPARPAGWVCRCGATLDDEMTCSQCRRAYRLVGETLLPVE